MAQKKSNLVLIDENLPLREACKSVFIHTEKPSIYKTCRQAMKYNDMESGTSGFRSSMLYLGITIGIIGLIPYAQNSSSTGVLIVGGIITGVGLLALLPEYYFHFRSESLRKDAIRLYNESVRSQESTGASFQENPDRVELAWVYRFN